jgi:hypothetical protein
MIALKHLKYQNKEYETTGELLAHLFIDKTSDEVMQILIDIGIEKTTAQVLIKGYQST